MVGRDLLTSCVSAHTQVTEGANARTAGEKRSAFGIARKEAGEAAGAAEGLATLGLVSLQDSIAFVQLADRLAGDLTGLVKRWS